MSERDNFELVEVKWQGGGLRLLKHGENYHLQERLGEDEHGVLHWHTVLANALSVYTASAVGKATLHDALTRVLNTLLEEDEKAAKPVVEDSVVEDPVAPIDSDSNSAWTQMLSVVGGESPTYLGGNYYLKGQRTGSGWVRWVVTSGWDGVTHHVRVDVQPVRGLGMWEDISKYLKGLGWLIFEINQLRRGRAASLLPEGNLCPATPPERFLTGSPLEPGRSWSRSIGPLGDEAVLSYESSTGMYVVSQDDCPHLSITLENSELSAYRKQATLALINALIRSHTEALGG